MRSPLRALSAVLVAGVLALVAPWGAGPAQAHESVCLHDEQGKPRTNNEPLSDSDRELLTKVRLAGLWEQPAGQMAVQKGVNPRVREIGAMISSQHCQLDLLDTKAAAQVGLKLPDEPNADQQKWLAEMRAAKGAAFDQVFVDRLRAAHGKIFPVIGTVRAGTRNSVVRELANLANGFVLTHLTLLESTGLVDYSKLPAAPASPTPKTSVSTTSVLATTGTLESPLWLVWVVGAFAALFGLRLVGYWLEGRREAQRRRKERWVEPRRAGPRSLNRPGMSADAYRNHPIPRHASSPGGYPRPRA